MSPDFLVKSAFLCVLDSRRGAGGGGRGGGGGRAAVSVPDGGRVSPVDLQEAGVLQVVTLTTD